MVDVYDELGDRVSEEGTASVDVAAGSGELKDPDMPERRKNGE